MSKVFYVFSTLSSAVSYAGYTQGGAELPRVERHVTIDGKAGIANKFLITPRGAVTKVTEEEMGLLESNEVFKLHRSNGFITVEETNADIDSVVANMEGRSPDAPLVPADYKDIDLDASRTSGNEVGAPETDAGGKGGAKVSTKK